MTIQTWHHLCKVETFCLLLFYIIKKHFNETTWHEFWLYIAIVSFHFSSLVDVAKTHRQLDDVGNELICVTKFGNETTYLWLYFR